MKIQCACGTKIAFDITPDMAVNPVQFICPNCGLDSSLMVNQLIRQQLGVSSGPTPGPVPVPILPPAAQPAVPSPLPPAAAPQAAPSPAPRPVVRLASSSPAPAPAPAAAAPVPAPAPVARPAVRLSSRPEPAAAAAEAHSEQKLCLKHPHKEIKHKCLVCGKPMCLDCMALFGYVCSPLCRNKAETRGMKIPVYAQQKSVMEARRWRKMGLIGGSVGGVLALILGVWFWYAWFGCVPKVAFSMKFPEPAKVGAVLLCGKDQIVYLHGGELGRIDMKKTSPVWSRQLVDKQKFGPEADKSIARIKAARERYIDEVGGDARQFRVPSREDLMQQMADAVIASMRVYVAGQNIWVISEGVMTQYDWQTGQPGKQIKLENTYGLVHKGDELVQTETSDDLTTKTTLHINLITGETTKESVHRTVPEHLVALLVEAATNHPAAGSRSGLPASSANAIAAKIIAANEARRPGAPLDPQKIAQQVPAMSLPAKLALPALIANARNQQRIAAELESENNSAPRPPTELDKALTEWDSTRSIPTPAGPVLYSATLIERRMVAREAMKPAPKKSALDQNVSAGNSMAVAGEMLNEMQRSVSSTVTEDKSRYQVTVKRAGAANPVWSAVVEGPPAFHALKTVNIITAGTTALALDQDNKQLWKAVLNYPVPRWFDDADTFEEGDESQAQSAGQGPCVERGDTVYIYDQGSLAAFDRNTGKARWRLPSVGISGLWFDDKGMLYINTTTASPDSIRYSKQINLNDQTLSQILKVNPKSGKTIWSREGAKHICFMWKKYIYTADSAPGVGPDDELGSTAGINFPAFVRIRRIDAGSGRIVWEHVEKRYPIAMNFHENTIQLMFKNEVENLKFLML